MSIDPEAKAFIGDIAEIVRIAVQSGIQVERDRCAQIADAESLDAREQIDRNLEYMARTGSRDESCNDLCRHRQSAAERIAFKIRSGAEHTANKG